MDLRDTIINRSFFLFLTKGYRACSLKDLEQATSVTKGAFYYYFKNKAEILKVGIEKYFSAIQELTEKEYLNISSLKEYMSVIVMKHEQRAVYLHQMFDFFIIDLVFFQLLSEVAEIFPKYWNRAYKILKQRFARWEFMILKSKQNGEIDENVDTTTLARNLMAIEASMVNIELKKENMKILFSDMRFQFEQYYSLIRKF